MCIIRAFSGRFPAKTEKAYINRLCRLGERAHHHHAVENNGALIALSDTVVDLPSGVIVSASSLKLILS